MWLQGVLASHKDRPILPASCPGAPSLAAVTQLTLLLSKAITPSLGAGPGECRPYVHSQGSLRV